MAEVPQLASDDIQGNILAGFNKDHQTFLFVKLPGDQVAAKQWIAEIVSEVATQREVLDFNSLYKELSARRSRRMDGVLSVVWMNVAFSASGLVKLGHPEPIGETPDAFVQGLVGHAAQLGHTGDSAPDKWLECFRTVDGVDAVLIIAGDDPDDLRDAVLDYIDGIGRFGGTVVLRLEGDARSDEPGHEHFGFKDGTSQPGVRGLTPPNNPADPNQGDPGQDLLWPGEFVLGYPRQKRPTPPASGPSYPPQPEPTVDFHEPGDDIAPNPEWTRNGSFLVFQRLLQDVASFRTVVADLAATHGTTEGLMGAKLVGRHKSGCPLEIINGLGDVGQTAADVGITDQQVLSPANVNNFDYEGPDEDGHNVPRAAHIRKAYPRDEVPPGELDVQTHRLLRRGIAFGASYRAGAPVGTPANGKAERGLLFACYQASVEDQFEFVQRRWVNDPGFPRSGDGSDAILNEAPTSTTVAPPFGPLTLQSFVTMTGGGYFFAPSISALTLLSS